MRLWIVLLLVVLAAWTFALGVAIDGVIATQEPTHQRR